MQAIFCNEAALIKDYKELHYVNNSKITKFWFLIKANGSETFKCYIHNFIINSGLTQHLLFGQFLSSTWFNETINIKEPFKCLIVEATYTLSYEQVENIINNLYQNTEDKNYYNSNIYNIFSFNLNEQEMADHLNKCIDEDHNKISGNNVRDFYKLKIQSYCRRLNIEFSLILSKQKTKINNTEYQTYHENKFMLSTPQFS